MEDNKILKDLENIFKDVLEEEDIQLTIEMSPSDINGWDSLSQINIIEEIEKHFNIHFSVGEIVVLKTISDMVTLIKNKIK